MGIQGLIQFIKPLLKDKHISQYKGERLGVDTYGWYDPIRLHKAIYACGREIATGKSTRV
jgi:exonuclease-1